MKAHYLAWLKGLLQAMEISVPDPQMQRHRLLLVERNFVLPVKVVMVGMIIYSFDFHPWFVTEASVMEVVVETVQFCFWAYLALSVPVVLLLALGQWAPLPVLQWTVLADGIMDGLLLAGLALISGGMDSIVFWLFVALIIRNSASIPPGISQLILNTTTSLCFGLVGVLQLAVMHSVDSTTLKTIDFESQGDLGQPFALRILVLGLTTLCCYGAQILMERQRMAREEAAEFAAREGQLHSAGRLAAEFAHQIKNPLAIIRNSTHSIQRAMEQDKPVSRDHVSIIQEEVSRADRVVTQIMGYAQLTEGRVQKLDVREELDRAIAAVFPPALPSSKRLVRLDRPPFPPLLMQQNHLSEILLNLLTNAREATRADGTIKVTTRCNRELAVVITIEDDGPGIAPENLNRIFEAYYTTKSQGSGLGLTIVKHNVELYNGVLEVDSELGKGVRFTITFPAKSLPKLAKP